MPLMLPKRREDTKDVGDATKIPSEKNPWKEIEGTVRKVDEEKVKDCTEDVDALLVFAGLYSAVLTAFLVESYKNLSADETNSLLQQLVLQSANYKFTNGYLNSTFDPSQLPTFKAAVSDIRVNVCWFASLILSLSSASFGIAVKQWLREFLAMDYISPQERLRIRDARIHGLQDWKLFQIAAFLPILLQVSLLLFFVGLCFFTAAVHPSIGTTSLFIVSCWAFLFFMSVIAPLFSPRCPYKTTILKVPFRYARPRVRAFLRLLSRGSTAKPSHLDSDSEDSTSSSSSQTSPTTLPSTLWNRLRAAFKRMIERLRVTGATSGRGALAGTPDSDLGMLGDFPEPIHLQAPTSPATVPENAFVMSRRTSPTSAQRNPTRSEWLRFASLPARLLGCLTHTRTGTGNDDSEDAQGRSRWQYYEDYMDLGILGTLSQYVVDGDTVPEEEDTIRSADGQDYIFFSNIDSAYFDDSLLAYMPQALSQRPPLLDVLRFVVTVIQHRSGSSLSSTAAENPRRREWPWTLSPRVRLALVDMLAESMEYELLREHYIRWADLSTKDSKWSASFVVLTSLVSPRDRTPSSVTRLFEGLHEYCQKGRAECNPLRNPVRSPLNVLSYQMKTLARSDPDWPARSLLFLAQALKTLDPEEAEWCLRDIAHTSFVNRSGRGWAGTYRGLLGRHPDDNNSNAIVPTPHTIVALLEVARVILHKYTLEQTQDLDEFPGWTSFLLEFVFDAVPRVKDLFDVGGPLIGASDAAGLARVAAGLFATPYTTRALLDFFVAQHHISPSSFWSDWSFFLYWIRSLPYLSRDTVIAVLDACMAFFESHPKLDSPVILLRFCLLIYYYDTRPGEDVDACWKKLSTVIHARYERILEESRNKDRFDVNQIACGFSDFNDQHTNTCKIAQNILHHCDYIRHRHKVPNEMVDFLRKFMCASGNAIKLNYLPNLDSTEEWRAEDTTSERSHNSSGDEQSMVLPDAISSHPAAADSILLSPTLVSNAYDRREDEQHGGIRENSVQSGLIAADVPTPGDAGSALRAPEHKSSGDAESSSVGTPHTTRADGPLAALVDLPIAVLVTDPSTMPNKSIHNGSNARPPAPLTLPDANDALDGDFTRESEESETTEKPIAFTAVSTGCNDVVVLPHALDSGGDGQGQLALPLVTDALDSSGDTSDTDCGGRGGLETDANREAFAEP